MSELTQAEIDDALSRIMRDVRTVPQDVSSAQIRRVMPPDGETEVGEDAEWLVGLPPGSSRWVLSVGGAETALDDISSAELLVTIASHIQDLIIDEYGKPWPEKIPLGVLEAKVLGGVAYWCSRGEPVVSVGELAKLPG